MPHKLGKAIHNSSHPNYESSIWKKTHNEELGKQSKLINEQVNIAIDKRNNENDKTKLTQLYFSCSVSYSCQF